ncbi:MAG TPA: hypothetical protein VFB06_16875 [Streptosporangiaceae bacterium]|nr:hypothetical protein [Streptosporangiaceae bacterium]
MRKLLLLAALASAAVVAVSLVVSTPARAISFGPSATGAGTLGQFGDPTVRVTAVATAAGLQGGFTVTYPDRTKFVATDTCLFVNGTTAYVTGRIILASGPRIKPASLTRGNYVIIGVADNGGAGPDLLNFSSGFTANPGCGPNFAATPVFPIVRGRFLVNGH